MLVMPLSVAEHGGSDDRRPKYSLKERCGYAACVCLCVRVVCARAARNLFCGGGVLVLRARVENKTMSCAIVTATTCMYMYMHNKHVHVVSFVRVPVYTVQVFR